MVDFFIFIFLGFLRFWDKDSSWGFWVKGNEEMLKGLFCDFFLV